MAGGGGRSPPSGTTARPRATCSSHPHVADHIEEGLDRLLDGTDLMETGEY